MDIKFDDLTGVTTARIDASVLVDGRLNVCLLQTKQPSLAIIEGDQSRLNSVTVIDNLLVGSPSEGIAPAIGTLVPGNEPALILAPEFAFGFSDWQALDNALRLASQPIILIAGFGATTGKKVLDWAATSGSTVRHLSWNQDTKPIAIERPVNGAWCWIHGLATATHCITYLKNRSEQTTEAVKLPNLQYGKTLLHVAFNDADLIPMICADFIPAFSVPGTPQAKLKTWLEAQPENKRPILFAESLLQDKFNPNWEIAIGDLLNAVGTGRPALVALSNVSAGEFAAAEEVDQWRALTGVYGRFSVRPKAQADLPAARAVLVNNISGAVARRTDPCVVSGPVSWALFAPTEKFVWHAQMSCSLRDNNFCIALNDPHSKSKVELSRLVGRYPPKENWSPRVEVGRQKLGKHLASTDDPDADRILSSLLRGLRDNAVDADNLRDSAIREAAARALHALTAMLGMDELSWQSNIQQNGQLHLIEEGIHVLIWREITLTGRRVRQMLAEWLLQLSPHPDLTVVVEPAHGSLEEGLVSIEPGDDITLPPEPSPDVEGGLKSVQADIQSPQPLRRAAVRRLDRVGDMYTDYKSVADDKLRAAVLLKQLADHFSQTARL